MYYYDVITKLGRHFQSIINRSLVWIFRFCTRSIGRSNSFYCCEIIDVDVYIAAKDPHARPLCRAHFRGEIGCKNRRCKWSHALSLWGARSFCPLNDENDKICDTSEISLDLFSGAHVGNVTRRSILKVLISHIYSY